MLNKKGQALIEFIIILPIFLILVMGIFDFGNIMYQRYKLENSVDYISELYENDIQDNLKIYLENNSIEMYTKLEEDYAVLELNKKVDVITPGLNLILGDEIVLKRVLNPFKVKEKIADMVEFERRRRGFKLAELNT